MNKALLLNLIVCFTLTACGGGGGSASPADNGDGKSDITDITPDDFSFTELADQEPSSQVTSNEVTLAGLDDNTAISIENGSFSINGADFTLDAAQVNAGDSIVVALTTASNYQAPVSATLTVGTASVTFSATTRVKDTMAEVFVFAAQGNAELSTDYTSNEVTLTGMDAQTAISISAGAYRINSGEFTSEQGFVNPDDKITVLLASSSDYISATSTALTVGMVTSTFNITTRAQDSTPNAFSFSAQENVGTSTQAVSNAISLSGIDNGTAVSVVNGLYSVNGSAFTAQTSQVNTGDTLAVQVLSAGAYETQSQAVVTVGTATSTFSVTTREKDITPNSFEFTTVTNAELNSEVASNTVTISGIDDETSFIFLGSKYVLNGVTVAGGSEVIGGTINNGDELTLYVQTGADFNTQYQAAIAIGRESNEKLFALTTRQKDTNPSYTTAGSVMDAVLGTNIESNKMTFTDFDGDTVSILGAEYKLNNGEWTQAGDVILNEGDTLTLRVLSSNTYSTQVTSSVGGNGWLLAFNVTTLDDTAPTFTLNKTLAEDGSTPLNGSEELVFTFNETMNTNSLILSGDIFPCTDPEDEDTCQFNLAWSENGTVLTLSPKEDFYWYSDKRSLGVAITGDGTLGLDETVSATVLPVFETFQAADVVIGQEDLEGKSSGLGINELHWPRGVTAYQKDGQTALLIADYWNNRVFEYSTVPTSNGADHGRRFGQVSADTSSSGNNANELNKPRKTVALNNRIYIADSSNSRVTWLSDESFDVSGELAESGHATSLVGQEDFGNVITGQCAQNFLASTYGMDVVEADSGLKLIVADGHNNRIMIWNDPENAKGADADVVLGQSNFNTCNDVSPGSAGLSSIELAIGVWSNGEKLFASSYHGNRLVVWNNIPTESNTTPDFQLGHDSDTASATNNGQGVTANQKGMSGPNGIGGNKHQMCVTDTTNSRVLIWSQLPESNDDLADIVIGQSDFTKNAENDVNQDGSSDSTINGQVLNWPRGCDMSMEQLFISDERNNRVLVFDALNKLPLAE